MGTHSEGANKHSAMCRECGQQLDAGQGVVFSRWDYPWDGSDTEGSIMEELERYAVCHNATECALRVVAQGTNVVALRRIAADAENLGDLATQANAILGEYRLWANEQAIAAELVAREAGYGAIGSGVV